MIREICEEVIEAAVQSKKIVIVLNSNHPEAAKTIKLIIKHEVPYDVEVVRIDKLDMLYFLKEVQYVEQFV